MCLFAFVFLIITMVCYKIKAKKNFFLKVVAAYTATTFSSRIILQLVLVPLEDLLGREIRRNLLFGLHEEF